MKYFIDTEFLESGPFEPVVLVSIGIMAGDGREYYAVSENFNPNAANDWVKANVLPHLGDSERKPLAKIAAEVFEFVSFDVTKPEFWGYYADYDWVVFCQMFGTMLNLPEGWPMFCRDLKQWAIDLGNPKLPEQDSTEHNALNDARWNKKVWEFLAGADQPSESGGTPVSAKNRCIKIGPETDWHCSLQAGHSSDHIAYEDHEIGGTELERWPAGAQGDGGGK